MLTASKLKAIEKRIKKRNKPEDTELNIPDNWLDFARMTQIRSAGKVVNFNPYEYQKQLVDIMLERSVCVVKSRQLGLSETIISFLLWRACLDAGYLALIISKSQTDTSLLARRVKRMISALGLKTTTENLSDIEIEGKGRLLFRNSSPDSGRGIESVCDVFMDECAFIEAAKEIHSSVVPAQSMLGDEARIFVVSTPNGKAGFYWDLLSNGNQNIDIELLCKKASDGNVKPFQYWVDSGGWGKILIHWKEHPIYGGNPNFLQEINENQKLSWETINQEYNLSFTDSEVNYFTADSIRSGAIGRYEDYDKLSEYFFGIDVSSTGDDYCICIVVKKDYNGQFSVVHLYRRRKETNQYHIYKICEIIEKYKPEIVAVEVTGGTGQVFLENISKLRKGTKFEAIRTTGDSKPAMLDRLKFLLESGKFIYPESSPLTDEMLNFRRNGKKLEAARSKHDDCIMASAFALAVGESYENPWRIN
jgi:Terminase RNaseH-like domain